MKEVLHLGHEAFVLTRNIEAVLGDEGNGAKNTRELASREGRLVDARRGRRGQSLLITRNGRVYWSAITAGTLAARLDNTNK